MLGLPYLWRKKKKKNETALCNDISNIIIRYYESHFNVSEWESVEAEGTLWGKVLGIEIRFFIPGVEAAQIAEKSCKAIHQMAMQQKKDNSSFRGEDGPGQLCDCSWQDVMFQILELLNN